MGEKDEKKFGLTRREFLGGGAVLLAGTFAGKMSWTSGYFPLSAQVTRKRIYLAPDDHTDYLWKALEAEYQQAFLEMIDYYLDQVDATAGNPSDFHSRWNCDGSYWMWTYEKNKPAADFQRLIDRIRDGHISVPLNTLCVCLGGAPAEAVLRGMYYPGQIERRYDLRFKLAYAIENMTLPYGLGALWAGSGVQYSWKGVCGCDSRVSGAREREHEIYWLQGPDGSRILMKWNSLLVNAESIGGYAEARDPQAIVEYVDTNAEFIDRYRSPSGEQYHVIGAFGQGWDDLKTTDQQCVQAAQSKSNASRRVIVSNQQDFFEDFEATYGAGLPSVACSFGNEWDLYCAAQAEVSARVKRAVEKLRAAEALASLVSVQDSNFMDGRQAARELAWMDLGLFWEHNFGMSNPPTGSSGVQARIAWQQRLAGEIESYVDTLHTDAAAALGDMIRKSGSNSRFYAFNPLSWTRTDVADFAYAGSGPVYVVDLSTGQQVPSQVVSIDGQPSLRVLAQDVPALGYKVFEVRPGTGQSFPGAPSANASTGVIENDLYQITVAPRGAITSLKDKSRGNREFARNVGGYYVNDLGSASGARSVENAGPVSATLLASVDTSSPLKHTTRITLFRAPINRIQIRNDINQNFEAEHSWRFGFNLNAPDVWHEEVGAIIRARLQSQGGHYSDRAGNSRYDWLTLNHFADVSGADGVGVTLSNADCYFMKLGDSTSDTLDTNTPQISVLVGARGIGGDGSAGLPNQGGDTHFLQRFALRTHDAYDPVTAMKYALEHQNPLVTGVVTGGNVYPETSYSLLSISNPNVLLWALKPADDGIDQGLIARLWNVSPGPASFRLALTPGAIESAQQVTHIETPLGGAAVSGGALAETLASQQLKTFSLEVSTGLNKTATPAFGRQGSDITYTLSFTGTGNNLTLTDTLPAGLGVPGNFELEGTIVVPSYDSSQHSLIWNDTPLAGQRVTIRYTANITSDLTPSLVNVAELSEAGSVISTDSAEVSTAPYLTHLPLILKEG